LHDEHDGHGQRAGVRADEHGGEDPAQQVAAGAVGDREVEHLQGEHERCDQADDRHLPLVERPGRHP
jgi:hypothetical protein